MTQKPPEQPTFGVFLEPDRAEQLEKELNRDIQRLRTFSSRGFWAFSLFLLISMAAWQNFTFLPPPDRVVALLGSPPKPHIISTVLLFYTFFAIILSLGRMMTNTEHKSSFSHVGYLTGFYLFYHFAKGLNDNYWAVFGAGITILGVESYRIWSFCNEAIRIKSEQVAYLRRTGRMPVEE
jgi:hypothetical protein